MKQKSSLKYVHTFIWERITEEVISGSNATSKKEIIEEKIMEQIEHSENKNEIFFSSLQNEVRP